MGKLFAFWRYDLFPHIRGGEVTKMHGDGCVETKKYGVGFRFKPFEICPAKTGRALLTKLDALREEYRVAQKKLEAEFIVRRDDIIHARPT